MIIEGFLMLKTLTFGGAAFYVTRVAVQRLAIPTFVTWRHATHVVLLNERRPDQAHPVLTPLEPTIE